MSDDIRVLVHLTDIDQEIARLKSRQDAMKPPTFRQRMAKMERMRELASANADGCVTMVLRGAGQ